MSPDNPPDVGPVVSTEPNTQQGSHPAFSRRVFGQRYIIGGAFTAASVFTALGAVADRAGIFNRMFPQKKGDLSKFPNKN